jgi:pyruvate/2-oxoglutarate dehydrogenase complex dihydrolipoamide dehydrogenase (E3) component
VHREDAEISAAIRAFLENEGVRIVGGVGGVRRVGGGVAMAPAQRGVEVSVTHGGTRMSIEGSHLLLAVGRRPNTDVHCAAARHAHPSDRGGDAAFACGGTHR